MSALMIGVTIAAAGALTFLLRWSFIGASDRFALPAAVRRALRFVPAAVLSALIWPAVLVSDGSLHLDPDNLRLIAAVVAALVAWYTRNVLYTIVAGMGTLWALTAGFGL